MTAYWAIVRWEVRVFMRRISTWVYFTIFFAIAFLFMLLAGGAFQEINFALGSGGKVYANSPYAIGTLLPVLSLFGISITAALAGNALYKDYEARIDPLFYTTPVSKAAFLGGRFTAAVIANIVVVSGIGVGLLAATFSPWVHADKLEGFRLLSYVQPYVAVVIPNLILTGAVFFALVALTRQMLPNYVGGALLLIGYLIAGSAFSDIDNKRMAALVDPFGMRAVNLLTQYWSISEKNARVIPLSGVLLYNRLLWLGVAGAIFAFAFARFRFAHVLGDSASKAASEEPVAIGEEEAVAQPAVEPLRLTALPAVTQRFDLGARWVQFRSVFARSFWRIVRNRYFGVIVGGGFLYLFVAARAIGKLYGTATWPVTYQMESILGGSFGIFILVIIVFYSGELIWAERDVKLNQMYDATPVLDATSLLAKFAALASVILCMLGLALLAGIVTQTARGYYHYEIPLYLEALLGFHFIDYLLVAVLAMTVHVLSNHKYLAHFLVILIFFANELLPALGLEHNLFLYGSDVGSVYSDMNGWGPYVWPFFWFKLYWGAFATLLLALANMYWVRGEERSFDARSRLARRRFRGQTRGVASAAALVFVLAGGFIFYNTNVLNIYRSNKAERHLRAERERRYKRFERVPQPRITGIMLHVDLLPSSRGAIVDGRYVLRNKTASPIDSIHASIDEDLTIRRFEFSGGATRVLADAPRNYYIWRLARPLAPGDSMAVHFVLALQRRGFANQIRDHGIEGNGTFLENVQFMPTIGYDAREELRDEDARKKEKLPSRPRMPPPSDPAAWANNYISHDADWLTYEATVSTDVDQTALASGYLQKEWVANGRRYFQYKMDAPILNLWAFQSARYAVKHATWLPNGAGGDSTHAVDVAVLYHPTHAYNVDRMIDAAKKALAYYTTNFSPYQYHQIRIVEFPRYATFAQSLPNTIPFSEAIGFIARVESADDIDYPFYVTAHEVAHQWWAHQVIGADAQGSTMLSETMAQYSALMVMEKEFGPANMRKFLEYELNSYLIGRSTEREHEMPLELGENQPYIHYNKGSLITYALRDYLGEQRMNAAVRGFLNAVKFKGPPYPTSLELVDSLRSATPDSLKYLIADFFENITLYELKTDSVVVRRAPSDSNKFAVDLFVNAKKLRADTVGKETEQPMYDWIDIGVFAKAPAKPDPKIDSKVGVPLYLAKQRIRPGAQKVTVIVDQKPYRAGIDPLHKLIDRITTDNTIGVLDRTRAPLTPRKK